MTITILWLVILVQAISLLLSNKTQRALRKSADNWRKAYLEICQIQPDVMCKNYGCGALKLIDACMQRDKQLEMASRDETTKGD